MNLSLRITPLGYLVLVLSSAFLPSCSKGLVKPKKEPSISQIPLSIFTQESPQIHFSYESGFQVKLDANNDGSAQTITLLPQEWHSDAWADPRMDIFYYRSLEGIHDNDSLFQYLTKSRSEILTWRIERRFQQEGYVTSYTDPDNNSAQIFEYYYCSATGEIYHIIVKPSWGLKVSQQILNSWNSLQINLKQASFL